MPHGVSNFWHTAMELYYSVPPARIQVSSAQMNEVATERHDPNRVPPLM